MLALLTGFLNSDGAWIIFSFKLRHEASIRPNVGWSVGRLGCVWKILCVEIFWSICVWKLSTHSASIFGSSSSLAFEMMGILGLETGTWSFLSICCGYFQNHLLGQWHRLRLHIWNNFSKTGSFTNKDIAILPSSA